MAPVLRHKIAHIGTAGDAVVRDFDRTNDRLWVISERNVPLRLCPLYPPKADIERHGSHVPKRTHALSAKCIAIRSPHRRARAVVHWSRSNRLSP